MTSGSYRTTRGMRPSPRNVHRSGRSVTCWKKVSIASRSTVSRAPSAASDFPLVRIKSSTEPQAPLDALSNISKSKASLDSLPWNQDHFSWPIASEIGRMSVADAIFDNTVMTVSPSDHFPSGWSFSETSIAMIAPTQVSEVITHAAFITLTHAKCACSDTHNLEQPTFEDALRSVVLCKLPLNALRDVEGRFFPYGSPIGRWCCFIVLIKARKCMRKCMPRRN